MAGGRGRKFQSLGRIWDYRKDPEFLSGRVSRKAPEGLQGTQTLEKVPKGQAGPLSTFSVPDSLQGTRGAEPGQALETTGPLRKNSSVIRGSVAN